MQSSRRAAPAALAALFLVSWASPCRAVEPDKLLPPDADAVVFVNLKQARESALGKKYGPALLKDAAGADPLRELANAAGLDVGRDMDSLWLAGGAADDKLLVVVRGRFDAAKAEAALVEAAKTRPRELKIGREGAATIYEVTGGGATAYAAFADATTLVVSPRRDDLAAALKRNGAPAAAGKELAAALKPFGGEESLFFVVLLTPEVTRALEKGEDTKALAKVLKETIAGTVRVAEDVRVSVSATAADEAGAKRLANSVNVLKDLLPKMAKAPGNERLLPLAEAIQKDVKVTAQGNRVSLSLTLSEDVIKKALGADDAK
jgi:hypothetical protein